jgi:hypothetical protein
VQNNSKEIAFNTLENHRFYDKYFSKWFRNANFWSKSDFAVRVWLDFSRISHSSFRGFWPADPLDSKTWLRCWLSVHALCKFVEFIDHTMIYFWIYVTVVCSTPVCLWTVMIYVWNISNLRNHDNGFWTTKPSWISELRNVSELWALEISKIRNFELSCPGALKTEISVFIFALIGGSTCNLRIHGIDKRSMVEFFQHPHHHYVFCVSRCLQIRNYVGLFS